MQCPKCGIETQILKNSIACEGDQSAETKTVVYSQLELQCRNPQCVKYGAIVETVRAQIN